MHRIGKRFVSVVLQTWVTALLLSGQGSQKSQIAELRQTIFNESDSRVVLPVGWEWDSSSIDRAIRRSSNTDVRVYVSSYYQPGDPITQLAGKLERPPFIGAFVRQFDTPRLQPTRWQAAQRAGANLPGYLFRAMFGKDTLNDSLHLFYFFSNGYSIEVVEFVAATKELFDRYSNDAALFATAWTQQRSKTQREQALLARLLVGPYGLGCVNGCR